MWPLSPRVLAPTWPDFAHRRHSCCAPGRGLSSSPAENLALSPVLGPAGQRPPTPSSWVSFARHSPPLEPVLPLRGRMWAKWDEDAHRPPVCPLVQTFLRTNLMFFSTLPVPFYCTSAFLVQNRNTKGGNLFKIPPPHFIFVALQGAHASDSLPIIICPFGALVTQSLGFEWQEASAGLAAAHRTSSVTLRPASLACPLGTQRESGEADFYYSFLSLNTSLYSQLIYDEQHVRLFLRDNFPSPATHTFLWLIL